MSNIVNAVFKEGQNGAVYTKKVYQYDRGVVLRISGVALPENYQVHFSNHSEGGVSGGKIVSGSDVRIPDAYFQTGDYVYIWLYFLNGEDKSGTSVHQVIIPVIQRPAALDTTDISGSGGEIVADLGDGDEEHTLIFHWN